MADFTPADQKRARAIAGECNRRGMPDCTDAFNPPPNINWCAACGWVHAVATALSDERERGAVRAADATMGKEHVARISAPGDMILPELLQLMGLLMREACADAVRRGDA